MLSVKQLEFLLVMYTIKSLQLNGYKRVHIQRPRDLYKRIGRVISSDSGSDEALPMHMNKLEQLEYMDELDRSARREEDYRRYVAEQEKVREEGPSDSTD